MIGPRTRLNDNDLALMRIQDQMQESKLAMQYVCKQ
jgi:hypothetical protein